MKDKFLLCHVMSWYALFNELLSWFTVNKRCNTEHTARKKNWLAKSHSNSIHPHLTNTHRHGDAADDSHWLAYICIHLLQSNCCLFYICMTAITEVQDDKRDWDFENDHSHWNTLIHWALRHFLFLNSTKRNKKSGQFTMGIQNCL